MIRSLKSLLLLCLVTAGLAGCAAKLPTVDGGQANRILVVVNHPTDRIFLGAPGHAYRAQSYHLDPSADLEGSVP